LYEKNNQFIEPENLLIDWSEPLMRSYQGVLNIINNENSDNYLIISYNDLILETENVLDKIYKFYKLEYFNHNLNNIVNKYQENDSIYNLEGMHFVRETISKRSIKNYLSNDILEKCFDLNNSINAIIKK